jgi:hypothetical protein
METPLPSADEIRRQMQIARQRVRVEVEEVVDGARQLADWRFYPRQFPWLTLGAAALAGFAVIPRRAEKIERFIPDAKALKELANEHKIVLDPGGKKAKQAGIMGAVLAAAGSAAARLAINYATQEVGRRFGPPPLAPTGEQFHDSSR